MNDEEREQLEERLAIVTRRLHQSFEHSLECKFVIYKESGEILNANSAACELLGRPEMLTDDVARPEGAHKAATTPLLGLIFEDDIPLFEELVAQVVREEPPSRQQRIRMQCADGQVIVTELTFHTSTKSRAALCSFVDVTERVQTRIDLENTLAELKQTQAQLVQQGKMAALGTLVAGVAHDINTPLGSIKANADLMKKLIGRFTKYLPEGNTKVDRSMRALDDAVSTTLLASERIGTIVRSLRKFARLDESELKDADLHEGLDSSLLLCGHLFKHRVKVEKDYGELPLIRCRPGELNQVFMNLLTNAAQAIAERGTIGVRTRHEADTVSISISDDGNGIDSEHLDKLFDPGFTTKGVGVGTGLGLAIAYRIVSDHGGRIVAESEPGQGATFTMTLPVHV